MRVNSLVQKTVILVYVTIPSINDFSSSARTTEGALDFGRIGVRGLLERYAINEVSLVSGIPRVGQGAPGIEHRAPSTEHR
jgi:tRNA-splicing endonuclease subunit Sen2